MRKIIAEWKWGNNPTNDEYTTTRCFIINGNYDDSLEAFTKMADEAKKDFPHLKLKDKDIDTGRIHGTGYMDGYVCISFLLPDGIRRRDYETINKVNFNW